MKPLILGPDDGEWLAIHGGNFMTFKATADATDGLFSLCHYEATAGWEGPPSHVHADFEESFYILEGEFEFEVDDQTIRAGPGTFLLVPRGTSHRFWNPTDVPAKLLGIFSPAGAEDSFRRRAELP